MDRAVHVDGERRGRIGRPGACAPRPGEHHRRGGVELTGVRPGEPPQERAQRGRCHHPVAEDRLSRPRPQDVTAVDAVGPREHPVDDRHRLDPRVGVTSHVTEVDRLIQQLLEPQLLGQGRRGDQPGVGHQSPVIEGHLDSAETARHLHLRGALQLG